MTQQASTPDALRLAQWLESLPLELDHDLTIAAELRRQHAEIELLRDELNLCCALKREYQQQAAGGIERRHAEIERLTGINSALCSKTNALTIQSARDAEEIEWLRADYEGACKLVADMHDDYRSASCADVARMVDKEMQYRAALVNLRAGMVDAKNTNIVDYIDAVLGAA